MIFLYFDALNYKYYIMIKLIIVLIGDRGDNFLGYLSF